MTNRYGLGLNWYWILGIIIFASVVLGITMVIMFRKQKWFDSGLNVKK
jgi:hypothetical protein